MIRLILDEAAAGFEQDIRELVGEFYPGEDFEIRANGKVWLSNASQEEKNALKAARESGTATAVNKKSTKNSAKMTGFLTPEGAPDGSITRTIEVKGETLPLTGQRKTDKSVIKGALYDKLSLETGKKLPWGDLTGIRPVSLVTPYLEADTEEDEIRCALKEEYRLEGEKLDLILDIARREEKVLDTIRKRTGSSYKDGWSLYIGIPFCPTRCLYCSFLSNTIDLWEKRLPDYMAHLREEIRLSIQEMCGRLGKPLQTIYIGGGTPTALNEQWLKTLMDILNEEVDFKNVVEFTVEAGRPDSITREKLEILKAAGVTRISVNPQSFNQKTLDLIGRKHSVESVIETYYLARSVGFDNINMDIILGLPGEKLPEVTHTLCEIARLKPDSLTVHSLAIKRAARLTLERDYWAGIYRAGDEQEILKETEANAYTSASQQDFHYPEITRMMLASEYTAELLGQNPYYLYRQKNMAGNLENTGYSLPGKECLYNILMMEERHTVIGCGAGTSSKIVFPGATYDTRRVERIDNGKSIPEYLDHFDKYFKRKVQMFSEI